MGETRIGKSLAVEGELDGEDDVFVLGRAEALSTSGKVTVDRRAAVHGAIAARAVDVAGEVEGPITASERIELRAEADVRGDLRAPRILIADGARFEGSVFMDRTATRSDEAGEEDES